MARVEDFLAGLQAAKRSQHTLDAYRDDLIGVGAAMRVGVSIRRNQFLVQHLETLGLVDCVGRAIVLLIEEAAEKGLPEPDIATREGFVRVTVFLGAAAE